MSRGRIYAFKPLDGFENEGVAAAAAVLEEAAERLYDVLSFVDKAKLHFIPEGSYLSIARLVKHIAWAEANWVSRLCGVKAPDELIALFGNPTPQRLSELREGDETAPELSAAIRRLRSEFSIPSLAKIENIDAAFEADRGPKTVRQVLSHLIWHWTYHSGQVGLTLLQAGYDYQWTFA